MSTVDYNTPQGPTGRSNAIDVDPDQLWAQPVQRLTFYGQEVASAMDQIELLWKGLHIQWEGPDEATAQDFINQLNNAMVAMFGPDGAQKLSDLGPGQGALIKMTAGIGMVAQNYGVAEDEIRTIMSDFADSLAPGQGSSGGQTTGQSSHGEGPIMEITTYS